MDNQRKSSKSSKDLPRRSLFSVGGNEKEELIKDDLDELGSPELISSSFREFGSMELRDKTAVYIKDVIEKAFQWSPQPFSEYSESYPVKSRDIHEHNEVIIVQNAEKSDTDLENQHAVKDGYQIQTEAPFTKFDSFSVEPGDPQLTTEQPGLDKPGEIVYDLAKPIVISRESPQPSVYPQPEYSKEFDLKQPIILNAKYDGDNSDEDIIHSAELQNNVLDTQAQDGRQSRSGLTDSTPMVSGSEIQEDVVFDKDLTQIRQSSSNAAPGMSQSKLESGVDNKIGRVGTIPLTQNVVTEFNKGRITLSTAKSTPPIDVDSVITVQYTSELNSATENTLVSDMRNESVEFEKSAEISSEMGLAENKSGEDKGVKEASEDETYAKVLTVTQSNLLTISMKHCVEKTLDNLIKNGSLKLKTGEPKRLGITRIERSDYSSLSKYTSLTYYDQYIDEQPKNNHQMINRTKIMTPSADEPNDKFIQCSLLQSDDGNTNGQYMTKDLSNVSISVKIQCNLPIYDYGEELNSYTGDLMTYLNVMIADILNAYSNDFQLHTLVRDLLHAEYPDLLILYLSQLEINSKKLTTPQLIQWMKSSQCDLLIRYHTYMLLHHWHKFDLLAVLLDLPDFSKDLIQQSQYEYKAITVPSLGIYNLLTSKNTFLYENSQLATEISEDRTDDGDKKVRENDDDDDVKTDVTKTKPHTRKDIVNFDDGSQKAPHVYEKDQKSNLVSGRQKTVPLVLKKPSLSSAFSGSQSSLSNKVKTENVRHAETHSITKEPVRSEKFRPKPVTGVKRNPRSQSTLAQRNSVGETLTYDDENIESLSQIDDYREILDTVRTVSWLKFKKLPDLSSLPYTEARDVLHLRKKVKFLNYMIDDLTEPERQLLTQIFALINTSCSYMISVHELSSFLSHTLFVKLSPPVSRKLMSELDMDGDGYLSFLDFFAVFYLTESYLHAMGDAFQDERLAQQCMEYTSCHVLLFLAVHELCLRNGYRLPKTHNVLEVFSQNNVDISSKQSYDEQSVKYVETLFYSLCLLGLSDRELDMYAYKIQNVTRLKQPHKWSLGEYIKPRLLPHGFACPMVKTSELPYSRKGTIIKKLNSINKSVTPAIKLEGRWMIYEALNVTSGSGIEPYFRKQTTRYGIENRSFSPANIVAFRELKRLGKMRLFLVDIFLESAVFMSVRLRELLKVFSCNQLHLWPAPPHIPTLHLPTIEKIPTIVHKTSIET